MLGSGQTGGGEHILIKMQECRHFDHFEALLLAPLSMLECKDEASLFRKGQL